MAQNGGVNETRPRIKDVTIFQPKDELRQITSCAKSPQCVPPRTAYDSYRLNNPYESTGEMITLAIVTITFEHKRDGERERGKKCGVS